MFHQPHVLAIWVRRRGFRPYFDRFLVGREIVGIINASTDSQDRFAFTSTSRSGSLKPLLVSQDDKFSTASP